MAAHPTALIDLPSAPACAPGLPADGRIHHAFGQPDRWLVATRMDQVREVLDQAHAHAQAGGWVVGMVAYEATPAFDAHLPAHPALRTLPLAAMALFPGDTKLPTWPDLPLQGWHTSPWATSLNPPEFKQQIHAIHELIRAGEVYQINLTTPLRSTLTGALASPLAYFGALHRAQPQGYSVYLDLSQRAKDGSLAGRPQGVSHLLSVSPELFFHWDAPALYTRPMKGTAPRGHTPEADRDAAQYLRTNNKERAENLMIVDLLRNDMSRVARTGSVQVPSLFDVQALPTVWQMTSTIEAQTRAGTHLSDVFAALFPCGSVTGAPKRRAMHHIEALETWPRGAYCGAIGVIQPGGACTFNVAIRTVELRPAESASDTPSANAPANEWAAPNANGPQAWHARCGIGSGITLDATAAGEAMEWHHKQAFLKRAAAPFDLLESMRLEDGQWARWPLHLARLRRSAAYFGIPLNETDVQAALTHAQQAHPQGVYKARLLIDQKGHARMEVAPLPPTASPVRVELAREAIDGTDAFVLHKTTRRQAYQPFQPAPGCLDTLLFNAQGEVTEFTIGNVAILIDGQWTTPPVSCGLLAGVMRESLLQGAQLTERITRVEDLRQACGMALINSVRGWLDVDWPAFVQSLPPSG